MVDTGREEAGVAPQKMPAFSTAQPAYARRLRRLQGAWWKRIVPVQAPYRRHMRRLKLGRVLDIGCGTGRNLGHLGGAGIGIDHNASLVETARARGLEAYTPDEFGVSVHAQPAVFDSLLYSHILEHMAFAEAGQLLKEYVPFLRPGGRVVVITPQERGYTSDPTHIEFMDFDKVRRLAESAGLRVIQAYSFPLPRWVGKVFPYNEFVVIARLPAPESRT
jgi:SAM-dependent methyltransferase